MTKIKYTAIAMTMLCCVSATAARAQTPNRLIVFEQSGKYHGYLTERIDSIGFYSLEGEVNASIEVTEVNETQCAFTATKTEAAYYLELAVVTDNVASYLNDDATAASYVVSNTLGQIYDDEYTGIISGLASGSNYVIMAAAIDKYGIACGVARAPFSTLKADVVGNPYVEAVVTEVTTQGFTVEFTPNDDVLNYAYVAGEKGEWQQQYEQWGPMFGFKNFGDMIMAWGVAESGPSSWTWDDFTPNTEYEVLIQAIDADGNYAEYQTLEVTTAAQGGEGPSIITITVGDFGEQNGATYQDVCYDPNENTAVFYDILISADYYNEIGAEGVKEYLLSYDAEQYYPQYSTDDVRWNAEPSTTYHACAMGKNALGEWGEMADVTFTTPNKGAKGAAARGMLTMIPQRHVTKKNARGIVPQKFSMTRVK